MKNRILQNNIEQETPSRRSMRTRQAVMACAASVFLAFSYTHQVAAQALSNSNETSNTTGKSNVIPTNIKELAGKTIDYGSYRSYVTTGRPNDDNTKKFLFYNVGSGKFLSVGSYWGTHATLSDVPNPFWLQRRNESIVGNQWGYVRYPEPYTPGTFNYDFFHITPMQLGSREGDNRSHATYQNIYIKNIVDDSVVKDLVPDLNIQAGQKFGTNDLGINFSTQYLEADIDLSDVQGNKNNLENILSLGKDISQWSKDVIDFHIYAYKENGEIIVRTQCLCKDYTDNNGKTTINVSEQATDNHIKLVVKDGSITINGIECLPGKKKADYVNPLANFMQLTSLQVGSAQGTTRTNATFKKVLWHQAGTVTPPAPSDEKYVVIDGYAPNGKAFGKEYNGTLNDYVIMGEINLGNCTTANENILSISNTSDGRWEHSTSGNANSIFLYYKKGDNTISIEGVNAQHTGASSLPSLKASAPYSSTIKVKCDKTGLYVGDMDNPVWGPDNEIVKNLLDASKTSIIRVGSEEGSNRSHATYNTLTVEKASTTEGNATSAKAQSHDGIATYADETTSTEGTDHLLFENKAVNGDALTEKVDDINLANGDYIEADIDLSGCNNYVENVFSIGANIADWGNKLAATSGNIHIYYLGKDDTRYKLYAVLVNKDHSDDFKRIVYVPVGEDMKLKYSSKGLIINDRDIYPDVNPMPDISYLSGHEGDIVRFKYADEANKIYEVDDKTHKYVIVAPGEEGYDKAHGINDTFDGYLYTTESRTDQTMPLFITSRFKQEATSNGNEGVYLSWAPFLQNNQGWGNIGIFGDRNLPSQELSTSQSLNSSQWFFEPVEGKTATYRIFLKMTNEQVQERNHNVSGNYERKTNQGEHKYYLQAVANDVYGNQLENYGGGYDDQTSVSASSYDGVEALTTLPAGEYGEWKLFDMDEYYQLFKAANTEMSQMLDLSFLLRDPDFTRENADLGTADSWKMDENLKGKIRIGYDNFSKKSLTETDYTDDQGKKGVKEDNPDEMGNSQFQAIRSRTNNHGRYMGVDINGINKTADTPSGKFYQTVTLNYPGWYAIRCGGATTVGSKLYVKYGDDNIEQPLHSLTQKEWNFLNGTSKDMVWPYDWVEKDEVSPDGMPMYNALVTMNDPNAATDTYNQAMKGLYDKWHSQVVFFIDPDVLNALPNKEMTVTFGIDVAPHHGTELMSENAGTTSSSENSETSDPLETSIQWTVFDNFHLLFGGNDGEPFLVLDEDDTTLDHLDKSIHKYRSGMVDGKDINKKLYLHRTFTAGKWNTIMLPVGLTKDQFDATFGAGTPVAELSKLTDKEIQFETVSEAKTYDKKDADGKLYDETAYWMKPMTPYIIKPSVDGGTDTEGYTAHLYTWASQGNSYLEKKVGGNGQKCFVIEHINMVEGVVKTEQAGEISTFGSKWDFAHMMTTINSKDYPYVMRGQVADQNGTMTAYGHLAKNFDKNATTGKNLLIDGRAAMDDSYTLSNNKLTYLGKGASSKAFRCWFQYTKAAETGAKKMPTLVLDGVDMTTGIDDITANDEGITLIGKYKEGIYTLGGQRISKDSADFDRLPKGIYIVDGKKIVKE